MGLLNTEKYFSTNSHVTNQYIREKQQHFFSSVIRVCLELHESVNSDGLNRNKDGKY